jgi:hypothetical protein
MRCARASLPLLLAGLALGGCGGGRSYSAFGTATNLTCVPYAERITGIVLSGDPYRWWAEADGRYPRIHRPEVGALLVFRPTAAMPLGHVAVVTAVLSSRRILVEHANWLPYRITRDQPVIDVSADNNWSRVRVWYPPIDALGSSEYPVYGFIVPGGQGPLADLFRPAAQ